MVGRGPGLYKGLLGGPGGDWDPEIQGKESVDNLRTKLVHGGVQLDKPQPITVTGTLFPCALLSSGWWDKAKGASPVNIQWRDGIQEWLFNGFDQWGPSWDFSWDFQNWERSKDRPYFIAQLGDGDEANSLPVLIPGEKAKKLQDYIDGSGQWGGIEADVIGVLGHRRHFEKHLDPGAIETFGGLLDYCMWIDLENKTHGIQPLRQHTEIYSGYLWRCVAPEALVADHLPSLRDVYFIWEHTNFANKDAIAYNLDSLDRKEEYLRRKFGKLVLVQKSSFLVPGEPTWSQREIYDMLLGRVGPKI